MEHNLERNTEARHASLNSVIESARERTTKGSAVQRRMEMHHNVKPSKKDNRSLEERYNHDRVQYVKSLIFELRSNNVLHPKSLEVVEELLIEYNVNPLKWLLKCNDEEYYYTCLLICRMVTSGKFTESEYIAVGQNVFKNPIDMEEYWKNLQERKTKEKREDNVFV